MTQVLGKVFLWEDDAELEAVIRRALRLTADLEPPPELEKEVFRACFTLASQAHVEMMQAQAGLDLSRLARGRPQ